MNTNIIREFNTKNFSVKVMTEDDYGMDLSWDETGDTIKALESGELVGFAVKAACYFRGNEIATDYLGGCIYKNARDFQDHFGIKKHKHCGSYFSDMVRTVIDEGRKAILDMKNVKIRVA